MSKTVVVANSREQAEAWRSARGLLRSAFLLISTGRTPQIVGLHPLASEVVLLEGWEFGAYSYEVQVWLERALSKRNQRWEDCRRETTTSPVPFVSSITGCARCGCDGHADVRWEALAYPFANVTGDFTHWAPCPNNGQPIMMRVA